MADFPKFGQVWEVWDKKECYLALVLNVGPERVKIVRVVEPNVKATPTYARLTMFTEGYPKYTYCRGMAA